MINSIRSILFIVLGIFSAAFGLEAFLLPNKFIDGGVTGISLLVSELTSWPLYVLILVLNIPFLFLGFSVVGKRFALRAGGAIVGLALVIATVPFPEVTHDKLLVAVFGGFFLGAGIGLSIRGGAVLDGTEILALYLSRIIHATVGDMMAVINVVIFLSAAYLLSIETALYSILTYVAASKTLDFVIEGIEEYIGVTIISARSEEIRLAIVENLGRGVTVYKGKGGYGVHGTTTDVDIVYTVITRLELSALTSQITEVDDQAFVVMSSVKDARGGMIKKRPLTH